MSLQRSLGGRMSPTPVSNYGMPFVGDGAGFPFGGRVPYWVDVNNGNDSRDGLHPNDALATIQEAIDRAQSGDIILIFPGTYAENLEIDGKDYITLMGAIKGRYGWPDIVPTTGKALDVQQAQGCVFKQLRFSSDADSDVVRQQGNGYLYKNCVFDGSAQAGSNGLLRLKGNADDDSYTASEGRIKDCLFRGSTAVGLILDTGDAPGNGVGVSDLQVIDCFFQGITGADIVTQDSGTGTYSIHNGIFIRTYHMDKNKATHIDFTTANGGAASDQTGAFIDTFINDDTVDTTAVKIVGTGFGFVGLHSMDGEVDASGLD